MNIEKKTKTTTTIL